MALRDITRSEVLEAIRECDRLGRKAFLERHGFGQAQRYLLLHDGRAYDSKAVVGVAHGFLPGRQPLASGQFSGGEDRVARVLRRLGFSIADGRRAALTVEDLVSRVANLRVHWSAGRPALYQPITLLWAVGRARRGDGRITAWADTDRALRLVLERHGTHGERPRPDYPVAALFHAGLWDLHSQTEPVPPAHGDAGLRRWFAANQPSGGLPAPVYDLLRQSGQARVAVIDAILDSYFQGEDYDGVLQEFGLFDAGIADDLGAPGGAGYLPGDPRDEYGRLCRIAERRAAHATSQRVPRTALDPVRSAAARRAVRVRSQGQCENPGCTGQPGDVTDCGEPILDVDHIRDLALGGSDHPEQMIALCPNCHAVKTRGRTREQLRHIFLATANDRHQAWLSVLST